MKTTFLVFLVLSCSLLTAFDIIHETFDTALPSGWTMQGPTTTNWIWSNTNTAGGSIGELKFTDMPYGTGTFKFISPAFDTRKVHDMVFTFRQKLDDYASSANGYSISVLLSTDLVYWDLVWSRTGTDSYGPTQTIVNIDYWRVKSQTTYLAFAFTGNSFDLNSWCIDNAVLSYTNTFGGDIWETGSHYPVGNIIIPSGQTLTLQPGTSINMYTDTYIDVDGRLLVNGTATSKVYFQSQPGLVWKGIDINNVTTSNDSTIINYAVIQNSNESGVYVYITNKVRISNTEIKYNSVSGTNSGGGIYCGASNIVMDNCSITNNNSAYFGSGAYFTNCTPTLTNNRFYNNNLTGAQGALTFVTCNVNYVTGNYICNNTFGASAHYGVYFTNCQGTFQKNVVANNQSEGLRLYLCDTNFTISHCDIVNNVGLGIDAYSYLTLVNCILWGHGGYELYNSYGSTQVSVRYCCVEQGLSGLYNVAPSYYTNSISSNPLFVNPTTGAGSGYDALAADWRLQDLSPCIDAGDPIFYYDDDFSNSDIGVYNRLLKPALYRAADVSPDQGHQIDLRWYRNDKDYTWDPSAWYHAFRWMPDRSEIPFAALIVTDPRQITPELVAQNRDIYWRDGIRTLYFLGQQKAMNRPDYGLIVPTLQDSSSTGMHDEVFVVTYFDNVYFWDSVGLSGYSVDNIPPLAPTRPAIARTGSNQYTLTWDEVSEGIWEGNTYEETNPLTYKIYGNADYDFELTPANLIATTTNPWIVLNNQPPDHLYYRIVVSDSE